MDKKIPNSYNTSFTAKNNAFRNEMPFQNMLIGQNNMIPLGAMPNYFYYYTNFLNKKREAQELSGNSAFNSNNNSKGKH